ncbi:hypothetical protein J1N35_011629 [Gossypium stocksii]|uniref:Aminotransferase-like plant mobile domain-containing protein n=1 Tax=Gossypium stocksii TaxID=47602 RepID=A0A9D3W2N5_9ROSI|nr:hypothetical protein J1N35_011629 [Gossypium stocksii]
MSHMLEGCKLDPRLISALMERWRPETHTFHLPCDKCTITLEDMVLKLKLSMDGPVITRAMLTPSKEDLCAALLGKVPNKFDVVRLVVATISTSLSEQPIHVSVGDKPIGGCEARRCVDSVHDGENARIRPGDATVWVEATNSTATMRPEGASQAGHTEEE